LHKSAAVRFGRIAARPPVATNRQRIGLLGGSFNPPHAAHRMISEVALKRLALDRVWWIVSPGNPLKSDTELAPLAKRMAASRQIAADARIKITAFEADLATAFTAATLAFLRQRYPGIDFVWIMGADNLAGLHHWENWRDIFKLAAIAVVDRPGWRLKALASPAARAHVRGRLPEARAGELFQANKPAWVFLTAPLSTLSSTDLRAQKSFVAKKSQTSRRHAAKPRKRKVTAS
jgi:nicotinate-nucleotide adenylyltransferase